MENGANWSGDGKRRKLNVNAPSWMQCAIVFYSTVDRSTSGLVPSKVDIDASSSTPSLRATVLPSVPSQVEQTWGIWNNNTSNNNNLYAEGGQTLQGSFSAVSKPIFASKYSFESSRRDLHNALESNPPMKRNGALLCTIFGIQIRKAGKKEPGQNNTRKGLISSFNKIAEIFANF